MAKNYIAIFGRRAYPSDAKLGTAPRTNDKILTPIESAFVVEIEAGTETVAEVQKAIAAAYPEHATDVVRVAVATEVKES